MSNPQEKLTALIQRIVRAEAGIPDPSSPVRVEAGAEAPHYSQEYAQNHLIHVVYVGEVWLTDYMGDLLERALQEIGCRMESDTSALIDAPLEDKEELLDTQIRNHLRFHCKWNGVRVENAFLADNARTYREVVARSRTYILDEMPRMGRILLIELEEALAVLGLRLDDGGEAS